MHPNHALKSAANRPTFGELLIASFTREDIVCRNNRFGEQLDFFVLETCYIIRSHPIRYNVCSSDALPRCRTALHVMNRRV